MKYVLFVCTHNAGRSQIAQAFFERYAPGDFRAESAGEQPAPAIWPNVIEAMREVGIDIRDRRPKKLDREMQLHADWAITLALPDELPLRRKRRRGLGGRRPGRAADRGGTTDPRRARGTRPRVRRHSPGRGARRQDRPPHPARADAARAGRGVRDDEDPGGDPCLRGRDPGRLRRSPGALVRAHARAPAHPRVPPRDRVPRTRTRLNARCAGSANRRPFSPGAVLEGRHQGVQHRLRRRHGPLAHRPLEPAVASFLVGALFALASWKSAGRGRG